MLISNKFFYMLLCPLSEILALLKVLDSDFSKIPILTNLFSLTVVSVQ